ncbi:GntR family transcriptional regulator [Georgenia sp. SUBG003]|uniref:GntR family transcriptional regulator n=1 Tax=Georgenia sp. SUBG003 TaxID=1497974 RepID=UPI00069506DD
MSPSESAITSPSSSATVEAYERLKELVVTNRLPPGAELREVSLAEQIGLGRTPIRQALQRLVHEGFVEVRPRVGYRVRQLTLGSVRDLFEMRLILEPAAVQLAIERGSADDLRNLGALARTTYTPGDQRSYEKFLIDNRELHVRIAQVSGNERLAGSLRNLLEEMQRLYFVSFGSQAAVGEQLHEHHDLFDAMIERDVGRARGIVVDQIESSREKVMAALVDSAFGPSSGYSGSAVLLGPER